MNIGAYGILIVFGAFILLLFLNPNLSCFGKKIRSPLYPLIGRKKKAGNKIVTEDYGFNLVEGEDKQGDVSPNALRPQQKPPVDPASSQKKPPKTDDYGFKLDD